MVLTFSPSLSLFLFGPFDGIAFGVGVWFPYFLRGHI